MDASLKTFGAVSQVAQAIAVETTGFVKRSFEQSTATFQNLVGAKTVDKAMEIQTIYVKSAYEGFIAQATKMGELYTKVAKDAFKPFERVIASGCSAK